MKLVWEEPPTNTRGAKKSARKARLDRIAKALKENPGKWAKVDELPNRDSMLVRELKDRGLDVTNRMVPNSKPPKYGVWARYNPQTYVPPFDEETPLGNTPTYPFLGQPPLLVPNTDA